MRRRRAAPDVIHAAALHSCVHHTLGATVCAYHKVWVTPARTAAHATATATRSLIRARNLSATGVTSACRRRRTRSVARIGAMSSSACTTAVANATFAAEAPVQRARIVRLTLLLEPSPRLTYLLPLPLPLPRAAIMPLLLLFPARPTVFRPPSFAQGVMTTLVETVCARGAAWRFAPTMMNPSHASRAHPRHPFLLLRPGHPNLLRLLRLRRFPSHRPCLSLRLTMCWPPSKQLSLLILLHPRPFLRRRSRHRLPRLHPLTHRLSRRPSAPL